MMLFHEEAGFVRDRCYVGWLLHDEPKIAPAFSALLSHLFNQASPPLTSSGGRATVVTMHE